MLEGSCPRDVGECKRTGSARRRPDAQTISLLIGIQHLLVVQSAGDGCPSQEVEIPVARSGIGQLLFERGSPRGKTGNETTEDSATSCGES